MIIYFALNDYNRFYTKKEISQNQAKEKEIL
jgi:hypothetical protein